MNRRTLLLVIISFVFLMLFACHIGLSGDATYDWPRWRGPNGNGISMETNWDPGALAGDANILWKVDIGVGYSNVAIEDNRLYAMGRKDGKNHVFCLNAETGQKIWWHSFETRFIDLQSTPTVDDNRVYCLSGGSALLCLKTKNGKLLWEKDLEDDFDAWKTTIGWATSPVVEGDLLLLNANTKEIALNKKNGNLMWSIEDEIPKEKPGYWGSYATVVVNDYNGVRVALFLGPSTLNAVEVSSGKVLWSYMHDEDLHPAADPVVFDNMIFTSLSKYCFMLEITENNANELWNNRALNGWLATSVFVDGYLYGTDKPDEGYYVSAGNWDRMLRLDWPFRCIDTKTGFVMWEKSMKHASLSAADGKLIMLSIDGTLRVAEAIPSSYRELSKADVLGGEKRPRIFATPPVLCNGKIYCRNYAGDLICIDVSK